MDEQPTDRTDWPEWTTTGRDAWSAATDALGLTGARGSGARGARDARDGGAPPWVRDLLRGLGGPGAPGRPRARRGDVRLAVLDALAEEPRNGYQVIGRIEERSGGVWRPSPGSVYPTIQQLEDDGLVRGELVDGRRLLTLTDAGRAYVAERAEEIAATWQVHEEGEEAPGDSGGPDLTPVIGQVVAAVGQVVLTGTRQQRAEAAEILVDTRRRLYGLLADGPDGRG